MWLFHELTSQLKHTMCHENNAGVASQPTNQVKVRPTIKLNIPQHARLGLFSRSTQGLGCVDAISIQRAQFAFGQGCDHASYVCVNV